MERLRKVYIPNMCISFTVVISILSLISCIDGSGGIFPAYGLLQLFGVFFVLSVLVMLLEEKLDFKQGILYPVFEIVINSVGFLFAAYFFKWCTLNSGNVIIILLLVVVCVMNLYFRSNRQMKRLADSINKRIRNN